MPFVITAGHHCQLLTQGKHLEMERGPTLQEVDQGGEQRNKYRFHTGKATWAPTEKSTKSMSTEFLVGTGSPRISKVGPVSIEKFIARIARFTRNSRHQDSAPVRLSRSRSLSAGRSRKAGPSGPSWPSCFAAYGLSSSGRNRQVYRAFPTPPCTPYFLLHGNSVARDFRMGCCSTQGGSFNVEWVAGFVWNQWQAWSGMRKPGKSSRAYLQRCS